MNKNCAKGTFGYDLDFLRQHRNPILLKDSSGQNQLIVSPQDQGRIMTATANGLNGKSHGWLNYDLIQSKKKLPQINPIGGSDRFWMGPEAGQYGLFFKPNTEFVFDHYQVPACIDTEAFEILSQTNDQIRLQKNTEITNYQSTVFKVGIERQISLLSKTAIEQHLDLDLPENIRVVGYESLNTLQNSGQNDWKKETGLLSIWILGMYPASSETTVIIPLNPNTKTRSNPVNDGYFGQLDETRLQVKDQKVLFKADGQYRSKIGIPPQYATPYAGSYDPIHQILTIVQFSLETDADYVNSLWQHQAEPYKGDVINSYNDGPLTDEGTVLGAFYELESSSPAKALMAGEKIKHYHRTYHFEGDWKTLQKLSESVLKSSFS